MVDRARNLQRTTVLLVTKYKFTRDTARRLFAEASERGQAWHGNPAGPGWLILTAVGGTPCSYVTVEEAKLPLPNSPGRVARPAATGYTSIDASKYGFTTRRRKEDIMARTRTKPAEPEEVEEDEAEEGVEEAKDYTVYAGKDPTATMTDFCDWLLEEVYEGEYPGDEDDFRNGVRLGGTLRMEFQRSEFNIQRREERKNAKPAKAEAEQEEEEEVKPVKGKPASRTKSAGGTRPAGSKPAAAARPRRGKATAAAEAPF